MSLGWQNNSPTTPIFNATVACGDGTPDTTGNPTAPCATASFARNLRTPYVITWNLDLQRAITPNLSLDLAYLGNHGVKLYGTNDINVPATGAGCSEPGVVGCPACSAERPAEGPFGNCNPDANLEAMSQPYFSKFPFIQYILQMSNLYRSHYNAVQASLTQRTSHGLSFTAAYTYSHATDDVSQNFGSTTPLHNENPGLNYGNSDYDIRHRFTFEATYAIPGLENAGTDPARMAAQFHCNLADRDTLGRSGSFERLQRNR